MMMDSWPGGKSHRAWLVEKRSLQRSRQQHLAYDKDATQHYDYLSAWRDSVEGSDADAALRSGAPVRHCVMGAGVYASHGYERSHVKGVQATFDLLLEYVPFV